MLCKKCVPYNFAKFKRKHLRQSLFFFIKKPEAPTQVLFCEFCEIFLEYLWWLLFYLGPCQTSMMERFSKNNYGCLTVISLKKLHDRVLNTTLRYKSRVGFFRIYIFRNISRGSRPNLFKRVIFICISLTLLLRFQIPLRLLEIKNWSIIYYCILRF